VINGLWRYGGARPWKFSAMEPARVCDDLTPHALAGDWAGWLDALAELDRTVLAKESNLSTLILTDHNRLVTLTHSQRWLPRWLTRQPHWTSWWHLQL